MSGVLIQVCVRVLIQVCVRVLIQVCVRVLIQVCVRGLCKGVCIRGLCKGVFTKFTEQPSKLPYKYSIYCTYIVNTV